MDLVLFDNFVFSHCRLCHRQPPVSFKLSLSGCTIHSNGHNQIKQEILKGYFEDKSFTVQQWITDQKVEEYDEMGKLFKEISLHDYFQKGKKLDPPKLEMFYTVCYNIDKFREFVFKSTFLKRFDIPVDVVEKIKIDDKELLIFGFQWLKYCLFGEKTMKVKVNDEKE